MTVPAESPFAAAAGSALPAPDTARITALVHGFYADVRADPLLGRVFENALGNGDWAAHLARMVDFWSTVVLGSKSYRGNVFDKHMRLQGVEPAHFAAWVRLWARQTERLFAPDVALELQGVAHGIGRNLFKGLFGQAPGFDEARVQAHAEHAGGNRAAS
ncbi:MAG: group III truncated hemoglobin [Comamonadaceae bacterium]|nr:MAG: group III truncated hemoglobin [Comamonadaceae bacterium]